MAANNDDLLCQMTALTRWLYCVECQQYSTRLEALAYLYVSSNSVACAEAYLRTKWHFDLSRHLATIDTGQNLGGCCAPYGELGSHLTQCGLADTYLHSPYQMAS